MEVTDVIDLEEDSEYFLSPRFKVDYKRFVYSITNTFTRSNIPQGTFAWGAVQWGGIPVHESLNVKSELDPHGLDLMNRLRKDQSFSEGTSSKLISVESPSLIFPTSRSDYLNNKKSDILYYQIKKFCPEVSTEDHFELNPEFFLIGLILRAVLKSHQKI